MVVISSLLLASACSKTAAEYVESGDRYRTEGKFENAIIQYQNARAKEPRAGAIRMKLAETFMASGNTRAAFPEFIRAADLMPEDPEAQLRAGHMLLKGGLFTDAKNRARVVLQANPTNIQALLLLGNALGGLKELDEAITVVERAVHLDPERVGLYTNLGIFELAQGDIKEAEQVFKTAVTISKGSPQALTALGNFYRAVKRPEDAERTLKQAIDASPKYIAAHEALASLYVELDRAGEAAPYYETAAKLSGDPVAQFALAKFYAGAGRVDDAVRLLEAVGKDEKFKGPARTRTALILFFGRRRPEAHRVIDQLLADQPTNAAALTVKARLLLADGQTEQALPVAQAAVNANSQMGETHLILARVLLALRNREDAIKAFEETIRIDPGSLPALLELAELSRRRRDLAGALRYADGAIRSFPNNQDARLMRLKVLSVRQDERLKAGDEARILLERFPKSSAVRVAVADFLMQGNDLAGARREFERALQLTPGGVEPLSGLVTMDLTAKRLPDARRRVDAALQKAPNSLPLLILSAKVAGISGEPARAENTLRKAIQVDPSDPQAYGLLADLYMEQGLTHKARQEFRELARLDPRFVGAPTMLGVLAYQAGQRSEAREWWEKAVRLNPETASASNNLAWLLAEDGTDLDRALELALRAKAQLPEQPEVSDTLGWVFYKKNMFTQAEQNLLMCTDVDPKNVMCQYHLGMVYAKAGEDGKAGRALRLALSLDPKFPGAELAKKTLATLVY